MKEVYEKIPAPELDELLREEFADCQNTALMVYTFNAANFQRLQLFQAQQAKARIAEPEAEVNRLKNKE